MKGMGRSSVLYTHFYIQSTNVRLPRLSSFTITAFGDGLCPGPWISPGLGRLFAKAYQSPSPRTTDIKPRLASIPKPQTWMLGIEAEMKCM
jgi:hypothetical protein